MPPRKKRSAWKLIVLGIVGVAALGLLWSYLDYRRAVANSLTPEHAQILSDVWNSYELGEKYRLCGTIDRPDEEAGLARFGLHYVQEVDRRGEELRDVGVPTDVARKDAANQVCDQTFGGTPWWDERETRPDGPLPISDFLESD